MINRILVPVDFSIGSAAALRYAEAMAVSVGAREVRAIHVFTPQTVSGDASLVAPVGELMDAREEAMHEFLRNIPCPTGIRRRSELVLGFPGDKIVEESAATDLVVLGATGDSDILEQVFGSIASSVAQRAKCPVLLVPSKAVFEDYRHILYASNSLSLSRRAVLKLMDFNELFRARIHFVHVNDDNSEHRREREKLFAPLFNNPDPEFAFEIVEVTAESVQKGLVDYLRANPVKLAVMVTQHRGFWERLFHHSSTKQMILHPEVPVLIFHLEE
ncbi:nucleotide-binding universal stress UspA family protein [Lewinella aquimaris]|uniref:Nucleotide-binding universal stress UspA family protein n=1 Tax=Neolewinella aquimaris TaxID=1835722 RepID=A0A840E0G1_9BACT|nr:universal stress protein [Neolewinella aquimaris]MBB4078711.1 nucleotide-binding universal stress UspA family protein [Neolewinella aquimaris]